MFLKDGKETEVIIAEAEGDSPADSMDMDFIATAREGWPATIAVCEELQRENERLRDCIAANYCKEPLRCPQAGGREKPMSDRYFCPICGTGMSGTASHLCGGTPTMENVHPEIDRLRRELAALNEETVCGHQLKYQYVKDAHCVPGPALACALCELAAVQKVQPCSSCGEPDADGGGVFVDKEDVLHEEWLCGDCVSKRLAAANTREEALKTRIERMLDEELKDVPDLRERILQKAKTL